MVSNFIPLETPFRRLASRECLCMVCGWRGSTNLFSRRAHLRSQQHRDAMESLSDQRPGDD